MILQHRLFQHILALLVLLLAGFSSSRQNYPKKESEFIQFLSKSTNLVYDSGFWSKKSETYTENGLVQKTKTRDFTIQFHQSNNNQDSFLTPFLEIDKQKIDLRKIYFWRTKTKEKVATYIYESPFDDGVSRFSIGNKQYIAFSTMYLRCNGSGCLQELYFLYEVGVKRLYVFDIIGKIDFADMNNNGKLDLLVVNRYDWHYPNLPQKALVNAYTQDAKGTFRPMADSLGKFYEIRYTIKRNKTTDEEIGIKVTKWHWFFEA